MGKLLDLTGKRFGRLTVLSIVREEGKKHVRWMCLCDCGVKKIVQGTSLRSGLTESCGCLRKEVASTNFSKHSLSQSRIYQTWCNMKARCDNPNNDCYYCYGALGIGYDPAWIVFEGFLADMLVDYKEGLTLERINPRLNYSRPNCTWVPMEDQSRNKRMLSINKTGVTGVHERADGYFIATWRYRGKTCSKSFSIKNLGERERLQKLLSKEDVC